MGQTVFKGLLQEALRNERPTNCWSLCGVSRWDFGRSRLHQNHLVTSPLLGQMLGVSKIYEMFLGSKTLALQGSFARQECCIYCHARAWVYMDEDPELANLLYTCFGRDARHRTTCPAKKWKTASGTRQGWLLPKSGFLKTLHH